MYANCIPRHPDAPGWDKDLHYVVSLDFFVSPVARMVPCGNLFEVVASKVFLAVPSDCPLGADGKARSVPSRSVAGRTVTLYVSDWDGDDFTEVCLPSNLEDDGEGPGERGDLGLRGCVGDGFGKRKGTGAHVQRWNSCMPLRCTAVGSQCSAVPSR